jgi:hypothetical protein
MVDKTIYSDILEKNNHETEKNRDHNTADHIERTMNARPDVTEEAFSLPGNYSETKNDNNNSSMNPIDAKRQSNGYNPNA